VILALGRAGVLDGCWGKLEGGRGASWRPEMAANDVRFWGKVRRWGGRWSLSRWMFVMTMCGQIWPDGGHDPRHQCRRDQVDRRFI